MDTRIVIPSHGKNFSIPGEKDAEWVKDEFGDNIPELSSMTAEETVSGNEKTITFRPRTGNKG